MLDVLKETALFIVIGSTLFCIFTYVCTWRMYVKAGVEGWWSLIPIANLVKLVKIARIRVTLFIIGIALLIAGIAGRLFVELAILAAVFGIIFIVLWVLFLYIKLFERFGLKKIWWVLVAFFCPLLGYAVIAFNPYVEYEW